jgi:hypothetical protein
MGLSDDAPTERPRHFRPTDLHPVIATFEILFGYTAGQLFYRLRAQCESAKYDQYLFKTDKGPGIDMQGPFCVNPG